MVFCNWFIYSVILAASPMLCRLLIASLASGIRLISESDIVTFGLILAVTNISALEISSIAEESWKRMGMGLSVVFVILLSVLFTITCFCELPAHPISETMVFRGALLLSFSSAVLSFGIWNRLLTVHASQKEA